MLSTNIEKSANYIRIVNILKSMLKAGEINGKEYEKAKKYYIKMTGADIAIAD